MRSSLVGAIEEEEFDPDDCFEDFGQTCMACNAEPAEGRKLLACQKCKRVKYCSRACQLTGWRQGHKESCCKRQLPTPSKVTGGSPQQVLAMLGEFHSAHGGLAFACLSRLGEHHLAIQNACAALRLAADTRLPAPLPLSALVEEGLEGAGG